VFLTDFLGRTFILESKPAVIKCPAISAAFFNADMIFHFFGDCGAILVKNLPMDLKLSPWLSLVSMIIRESSVKCFCLFIRDSFLSGRSSHIYITESLERLNSTIEGSVICIFKFHRGVEFKYAIEYC